jgi:tetratricopeptide (TPR) repeat protein
LENNPLTNAFEQSITRASELIKQGNTGPAMELLQDLHRQQPENPMILLLTGMNQRKAGLLSQAVQTLSTLLHGHPEFAAAYQELGICQRLSGQRKEAFEAFRKATELDSRLTNSWTFLGDMALVIGDEATAIHAYSQHPTESKDDPMLVRALELIEGNKLGLADIVLRSYLGRHPGDAFALYSQSRIATKLGATSEAITLLESSLNIAPGLHAARYDYVNLLSRRQRYQEALVQIEDLLAAVPNNHSYRMLKAALLERTAQYEPAVAILQDVLSGNPDQALVWTGLGGLQRTLGRRTEAITSLQKAIDCDPVRGEAWCLLADLKTYTFSDAQIEAMRLSLEHVPDNSVDDIFFSFALARALEDRGNYAEAFEFYQRGNNTQAQLAAFNPGSYGAFISSMKQQCQPAFFDRQEDNGCPDPAAIFIVGLPRSGSTLLEQIISSHSQVDATMELAHLGSLVSELNFRQQKNGHAVYPAGLENTSDEELQYIGQEYIRRTQILRGSAPYFIDKMPNNFEHIGLIHLALPNAKIIDIRREPMSTGLSAYKQLFRSGKEWSYQLSHIGQYYLRYLELMNHWDEVLPAKIHHVRYEDLVEDTEQQVQALMNYLGLPFEAACLSPELNQRAVRTASSEQVRQPIHTDSLGYWKKFENQLDPLKQALAGQGT